MAQLVSLMGDPQSTYPVVHLTGTNGKGSTARMLTRLFMSMGLTVGTYTSPDLEQVNERLAFCDEPVSDEELAESLDALRCLEGLMAHAPSRFELLTAAAFRWFADRAVDVAVVEVGLGGLWDATNVAEGKVAVVTNVSLDHAEILGPSLADISGEKSGIVKPGSLLVLGETDPELMTIFEEAGAAQVWKRGVDFDCDSNQLAHGGRLLDLRTPEASYPEIYLPVHGAHQGDNAACALAAAEAFFGSPLALGVVEDAFAAVRTPGRMEVVGHHPLWILDGAHNPAGAAAAAATLAEEFSGVQRMVVVMGLLRGRDPMEMLSALDTDRVARFIACPPASPRALPPEDLAAAARSLGLDAEVAPSARAAVTDALAGADPERELVLVTGSLYVVGEARSVATAAGGRRS